LFGAGASRSRRRRPYSLLRSGRQSLRQRRQLRTVQRSLLDIRCSTFDVQCSTSSTYRPHPAKTNCTCICICISAHWTKKSKPKQTKANQSKPKQTRAEQTKAKLPLLALLFCLRKTDGRSQPCSPPSPPSQHCWCCALCPPARPCSLRGAAKQVSANLDSLLPTLKEAFLRPTDDTVTAGNLQICYFAAESYPPHRPHSPILLCPLLYPLSLLLWPEESCAGQTINRTDV
jgi:hypothetical protein